MKQSRCAEGIRDSVQQVFLDGAQQKIGTFYPNHGGHHGTHAFAYALSWLENPEFFDLDPHLLPCEGEQYQPPSLPIFGMLRDAIPDRWGRRLLDRAEAVAAGIEHRPIRSLDETDYLLAVEDVTRVGALRFYRDEDLFLKESTFPVPTLQDLRSLAGMDAVMATSEAYQLNRKEAAAILDAVVLVISTWREEALRLRISRREIQMMEDAFMANIPYRR